MYEGATPVTIETTYLGGYEKVVHTGGARDGKTEHKYMLGGVALKIDTEEAGVQTGTKTRYLHKDHLGSVVAITDETGAEKSRFRYDPFGKQYTVVNQSATNQTAVTSWLEDTQRGFTGHEMLSSVDIIHMNGRIYDANIGRFMQADAYIQAPKNMQSMNRYSYVLNNPLSYTDPSGNFFKSLFKKIASIPILDGIIRAVFAVYCQYCLVTYSALSSYAATGSLSSAILAGISAGSGFWGRVIVAGISSHRNGGSFGKGAAISVVSNLAGKIGDGVKNVVARFIIKVVVGGTVSRGTGGKFANGAVSAAFSFALTYRGSQDEVKVSGSRVYQVEEGQTKVVLTHDTIARQKILNPAGGFENIDDAVLFGYRQTEDLYFQTASNEEVVFLILKVDITDMVVENGESVMKTLAGRYIVTEAIVVGSEFSFSPDFVVATLNVSNMSPAAVAHTHPNLNNQNGFSGTDIKAVKRISNHFELGGFLRTPDGSVGHMSVANARGADPGDLGRLVGTLNRFPRITNQGE